MRRATSCLSLGCAALTEYTLEASYRISALDADEENAAIIRSLSRS
jgi:hypothetical protein